MHHFYHRKPRLNQKGFTLAEILIAMAIASIGFLGIATLANKVTNASVKGNMISTINNLASSKMNSLALKAFDLNRYNAEYHDKSPFDESLQFTTKASGPHVDFVNYAPYKMRWYVYKDAPISGAITINLEVDGPDNISGNPIIKVNLQRVILQFKNKKDT